jgi:hypothetical protein
LKPGQGRSLRRATLLRSFVVGILLAAAAPVQAEEAPYGETAIETIRLRIDGEDYAFGHRSYPKPVVLDLGQASGTRDTPYDTLLSYHRALAEVSDYDAEVAPFLRKADGEPGAPPADEAAHNEAARQVLAGDIVVHGEIHLEAYTIFIIRYANSIPRNLGIAIRRFEAPDYVVVQDLILHDRLAYRLSAARWDVAELEAKYPAE